MYVFEFIAISWVIGICLKNYRRLPKGNLFKKQIIYIGLGIVSFLSLFVGSNILGETLRIQQISFIGSLGMVIFLAFLSYLIVRYNTFNIKVLSAQALVLTLIILIGATLLVDDLFYSEIIIAVTLMLVIGLGYLLTQNVKREVEQREKIEKLAKDLEVANEKLKEVDQLKSEFLSLATHQIRAPLTAIKGYASMLLEGDFGVLPRKSVESVRIIMKSCQNLVNIVNDFLNISRIEQGRMVYEKTDFNLAELAKEVVNEIKPNIQNAGLSLDLKIADDLVLKVNADRDKIKQVIGNILDNSIKYTPRGKVEVSVFKDGAKAKVAIKDTGVGIDPKDMVKLFEKFSRAKDANKTNVIGTGLGLYIAKKMTEAQGGDIKIVSEGVGKGSTFTIELPVK
jgi:signal transduction histidine kinase